MPWHDLRSLASTLAASIRDDLVLGFPVGPQVLALRPDDPDSFRQWATDVTGVVPMQLRYAPGRPHGEWIIAPNLAISGRRLVLRFGTPPALAEWLFAGDGDTRRRLHDAERGLLSRGSRSIRMVVLSSCSWTLMPGAPIKQTPRSSFSESCRRSVWTSISAWDRDHEEATGASEHWSFEAVAKCVDLLQQRDPSRLEVLLYAAAHGDWISRAHVYELMGLEPRRKMTGFTRPFEGVRKELIEEGTLPSGASHPVVPRYTNGDGWAVGLDLDPDFGTDAAKATSLAP